jgi:glucan biosynthesis protein C
MNATSVSSTRRYDFDWLRVLLILTVLFYHSLKFFDMEYWHIKNAATYMGVQIFLVFLTRWMMPAIFIISGVATFYALGKRGAGRFIKDRSLRLLVPLLVGIFTHVILQGYLEEINHNQYSGSFWQFYAERFNGLNGLGGNFNWVGNHLWYLEMLFVFSLVCLPLFLWLRNGSGKRALSWLGDRLSAPGAVYLLALPTLLVLLVVNPGLSWVLTEDGWGGWSTINHLIFFLAGFLLASSQGMQASIRRLRWVSLAAGVVTFLAGGGLYLATGEPTYGTPMYYVLFGLSALIGWGWMLAIFGFGLERLNRPSPALEYANEAVLPFYIMHQTVLVVVGFFVVSWAIPDLFKWIIILLSTFVIIMALYEFIVRRVNLLRVLFGMKPVYKEKMVQKPSVQEPPVHQPGAQVS